LVSGYAEHENVEPEMELPFGVAAAAWVNAGPPRPAARLALQCRDRIITEQQQFSPLETGVLARDFADASTPVPGGGLRRGQSTRSPAHRDLPPADEHDMAARLTDVTVAYERTEAFREVVAWVAVSDVALLSSLPG
jgi:hypothetical protein